MLNNSISVTDSKSNKLDENFSSFLFIFSLNYLFKYDKIILIIKELLVMNYYNSECGRIEVVCGPMFAGKTEEIIRRITRMEYAKKNFIVFKPL